MVLMNVPSMVSQGGSSMNRVILEYDNKYRISYEEVMFAKGEGMVFDGYVGYFEKDGTSASCWGWYYEQGRNTDGEWDYDSERIWDYYVKEHWAADDTGSNFQNTQAVSVKRMENPHSITLVFYIVVIGGWSGRTNYSWHIVLTLQDPGE